MMMYNNYNNDYDHGYGSGASSSSLWMSQQDLRRPPLQPHQAMERQSHKSSSYSDLVIGQRTLDLMREFHMNGSDTPYEPDEDDWGKRAASDDLLLSGMGPHSAYLRQKSWPAPERSPAAPLPRAAHNDFAYEGGSLGIFSNQAMQWTTIGHSVDRQKSTPTPPPPPLPRDEPTDFATSTPVFDEVPDFTPLPMPPRAVPMPPPSAAPAAAPSLSAEQARVLSSLPPAVLNSLLRQLQHEKRSRSIFHECRFCKNNGERESFYRGHVLKDAGGRVACPVLRAFRCHRCGATGDQAHTIKYCPLSTNEERIKSTFMMRSVRMASGRRRAHAPPSMNLAGDYMLFGEPTPSMLYDGSALSRAGPLDPLWAALEQKLLL